MRIIGGKYRSRRIQVPANLRARPTTDFARESLFNVLNNRVDWEETVALDLFSGTGSVALELVSRGCPRVICVEQNPLHHSFILKTKELLGATELLPVKADAFRYLQTVKQKFGLIFADPPYDLPGVENVPTIILEKELLDEGGIFVMEHSQRQNFSHLPLFKSERRYGNVHFSFFVKE